MKNEKKSIRLDPQGVDEAAEAIQAWLTAAGAKRRDMLRIRLTMEEMLSKICENGSEDLRGELRFTRFLGAGYLSLRYGGEQYDPTRSEGDGMEALSAEILERTGFLPTWRRRGGENELRLRFPLPGLRPEYLMLICIAAAAAVGFAGARIPAEVRAGVTDFGLRFLADGFLDLLNTFIGLMIFLAIVTGICGIGSISGFGRIGKLTISRFLADSFLLGILVVLAARFFFSTGSGGTGGGSQVLSILEVLFGILPGNPIRPFLEGNNLQIVFMGVLVGVGFLLAGNEAEGLRRLVSQAQSVVMRCVSLVCLLLPVYIFCSLVMQIWDSGAGVFLQLWKPLLVTAVIALFTMGAYLAVTCRKLRVKPGVLIPKLLPGFLIGLSTCSSAAVFPTALAVNDEKLGVDPSFSRTAMPLGIMLYAGMTSAFLIISCVYAAECCGVGTDPAWWIILWFVGTILTMAVPPVAGGGISCLSLLLVQMHVPREGLAIAVALSTLLDFICTAARMPCLQMETALLADRLGLLDRETLQRKN